MSSERGLDTEGFGFYPGSLPPGAQAPADAFLISCPPARQPSRRFDSQHWCAADIRGETDRREIRSVLFRDSPATARRCEVLPVHEAKSASARRPPSAACSPRRAKTDTHDGASSNSSALSKRLSPQRGEGPQRIAIEYLQAAWRHAWPEWTGPRVRFRECRRFPT